MRETIAAWLRELLGLETDRKQSEWQFRQLEERCIRLESMLDAIQMNKLKFYADKGPARMPVIDFETSQKMALEEFKEQ